MVGPNGGANLAAGHRGKQRTWKMGQIQAVRVFGGAIGPDARDRRQISTPGPAQVFG
jgi:hypothetical protein